MENGLIRILLFIGLFFLLSTDLSHFMKRSDPYYDIEEDELDENDDEMPTTDEYATDDFDAVAANARKDRKMQRLVRAVRNSCLPKLICELSSMEDKNKLTPSEIGLLKMIKDTSMTANGEVTKYHFAAHMGQLISGVQGAGCHNFYPDCPIQTLRKFSDIKIPTPFPM